MRNTSSASEFSEDRANLARDLIRGPLGRQAAHEGWIWNLYVFCTRHARLPEQHEINEGKHPVRPKFDGVASDVERAARGELGIMSKPLLVYGESLLKRRDELRDFVLHGVVK